jgi:hypothetical protein
MGDRSFIQVSARSFQTPITIYGHWSGVDNLNAVRNVLSRSGRIGEPSYLTAQLFYEYAKLGNYNGELSFGIRAINAEPNDTYDDNPVVVVNADIGSVQYDGETYTAEQFALAYADKVS